MISNIFKRHLATYINFKFCKPFEPSIYWDYPRVTFTQVQRHMDHIYSILNGTEKKFMTKCSQYNQLNQNFIQWRDADIQRMRCISLWHDFLLLIYLKSCRKLKDEPTFVKMHSKRSKHSRERKWGRARGKGEYSLCISYFVYYLNFFQ